MKAKKCKVCKKQFSPFRPLQQVCSLKCASEHARQQEQKRWKKKKAQMKEEGKTLTDWKADLQKEVNQIIHLIDKDQPCVSCGGSSKMNAGHFHAVGSNDSLRFHFENIWLQDVHCNMHKGGNNHEFDNGLIELFGKEYWEELKFDLVKRFPLVKFTVADLQFAISEARKIKKELKQADQIYPTKMRVALRKRYNERLKLYA